MDNKHIDNNPQVYGCYQNGEWVYSINHETSYCFTKRDMERVINRRFKNGEYSKELRDILLLQLKAIVRPQGTYSSTVPIVNIGNKAVSRYGSHISSAVVSVDIVSGAIREYSSPQVAATLHRSKYGSGHWRIKNCCNNVKGYNSAYGKKWYWKKDWVSMQQEN